MTPPIIALIGRPDSGKTTLLEKLIPELSGRGLRIGTVKHHVHGFEMDREGKDTWRHKRAGARVVALSSPSGLGVIRDVDHDHGIGELIDRYYHDVDLVIAEGYKRTALPKIEIFRSTAHQEPLSHRDNTWVAMVSDRVGEWDLPTFKLNDITGLADFIITRFMARTSRPKATLLADGTPVPLNDFVETFLRQAVQGMVTSLKGCREAREITITIRNDPNRSGE
ncbi:MAG: molybdopterin-guanine dinucleotide biosynthesis protein B [Proteobacteria bacterium]|nr:molybdopterin-guanine dinucleotide biosynthesis protein B [Pseudomonadota bacterium]MBU1687174.1 molybdopterin-guanine dinucleotide biosynthesis protein B [Pseudomonadota bacterium]